MPGHRHGPACPTASSGASVQYLLMCSDPIELVTLDVLHGEAKGNGAGQLSEILVSCAGVTIAVLRYLHMNRKY